MNLTNKNILIIGSNGFIAKNLIERIKQLKYSNLELVDRKTSLDELERKIISSDIIFHLAGANRPTKDEEFEEVNTNFTASICEFIKKHDEKQRVLIFTSSQKVYSDTLYGKSKLAGELSVQEILKDTNTKYKIIRLTNVFGKWCRPNYNSVVATFCYNIARDLEIKISDREAVVRLIYVEDLIDQLLTISTEDQKSNLIEELDLETSVTLGELSDLIRSFKASRQDLIIPNFGKPFIKKLHSTYLSYLPEDDFSYRLKKYEDNRGVLYEIAKSETFGQIFFSTTKPGITRGNHFHNTKVEKFIVLAGDACIRFRKIDSDHVVEYYVTGAEGKVVDIPIGYTHSIENIGDTDLSVMFYANEIFDQKNPDTFFMEVLK